MKLFLDYTQRLNLHALMGAQRASVDDLRMFWKVQDMIELAEEEKQAIGYKVTSQPNGAVQVQWDVDKELPVREYELRDEDVQRLRRMMREWQPGFLIGADRRWIEPLMMQLDAAEPGAQDKEMQRGLGSMAMSRK